MGLDKKNILIADNGNVVEVNESSIKMAANIPAGRILVDGYGVGDVGSVVMRDRRHLALDGLIIVSAALNIVNHSVVSNPEIVSRGFVYVKESEQLIEDAKKIALSTINDCFNKNMTDAGIIKAKLRDDLSRLMYERTKRSPMILPVIIEI